MIVATVALMLSFTFGFSIVTPFRTSEGGHSHNNQSYVSSKIFFQNFFDIEWSTQSGHLSAVYIWTRTSSTIE